MNKTGKIILIAAIIIATAVVVALVFSRPASTPTNTDTSGGSSSNVADTSEEPDVTIIYDGASFNLSAASVKSGGIVRVINKSQKNLEFDSDPHPVHTDNTELNAGGIEPGKSATFTLTTKGSWGFHNHLNASQKGELTVE
jgi:plastocyanin